MKKHVRMANEVDAFVGTHLKALRKSAGLSQTALANQIGVTFQQVQKYERGTNRIGASRLWSLCEVLNVKPSRFFEGLEAHLLHIKTQDHYNGNLNPISYQDSARDNQKASTL